LYGIFRKKVTDLWVICIWKILCSNLNFCLLIYIDYCIQYLICEHTHTHTHTHTLSLSLSLSLSFLNYYTLALRHSLILHVTARTFFDTWILLSRKCFLFWAPQCCRAFSFLNQQEQRISPKCIGGCVHVLFPFNRVSIFKITFP